MIRVDEVPALGAHAPANAVPERRASARSSARRAAGVTARKAATAGGRAEIHSIAQQEGQDRTPYRPPRQPVQDPRRPAD